ncbi:MAG: Na+/H+ antiporter NhaA [Pedobacter sp.]|nr:MAG: Na+/H+ antiporter NhaA [Pedobacter sp.]
MTNKSSIFKEFVASGKLGSLLLFTCVVISLFIANSSIQQDFNNLLNTQLGANFGNIHLTYSLATWVNDGLMAIFFLLVGLEIKRELVHGELSSPRKAALPIFAAMGGMLIPALIYFLFNKNHDTAGGWGIPMATDIAFALALISVLGKHIPSSLKIFLAALAIVDDLGAIIVIAVFYTEQIHWDYLLMASGVLALLITINYFKISALWIYLILGLFLWYFLHHSGIHATIAGVLLALCIPIKTKEKTPALIRLEHSLTKPVNFLIMPIFALANTNISFRNEMLDGLFSPLGLGIVLGLFVGKTLGITLFSWFATKMRVANLPSGANWKHMTGVGMLAGIGFTMSIFISLLSFNNNDYILTAKFAVLCASFLSGLIGFVYLRFFTAKT